MVSLRRFGPLLGTFALALALLAARLYDLQVREHPIWAREAANLVRSSFIEPYERGRILDRNGQPFVRDQEAYELDFVWRDFRRSHPLGQIAALRSLSLGRPVGLEEARAHLVEWGEAYARLSPAEIEAFGRGEALVVGGLELPAAGVERAAARRQAREERRAARASDIHYYLKALLHPARSVLRALPRGEGDAGWSRPYLDLVAEREGVEPLERLRRLRTDLERSLGDLDRLARALTLTEDDLPPGVARLAAPLDRLIGLIEETRSEVESDIADDLFERAAGFGPTRLAPENLARLDLEWLRRALVWDAARLESWRNDRGAAWEVAVREHLAGYAIARSKLHPSAATMLASPDFTPGNRVLSSLAYLFNGQRQRTLPRSAQPRPWSSVDELVVLADLVERLERGGELAGLVDRPLLAFQNPELRRGGWQDEELLARALSDVRFPPPELGDGGPPAEPLRAAVGLLLEVAASPRREWNPGQDAPFARVLLAWNARLQARVAELLDGLGRDTPPRAPHGSTGGAAPAAPVALGARWIDLATKARGYVVRDRGARGQRIGAEPSYELVRLVTRYPERYEGFVVRTVSAREPLAFLDPRAEPAVPVAQALIGKVRPPALLNLLEQRPRELALAELQQKRELPEEDRELIVELAGGAWQEGLSTGSTGIEAYLDRELRGRNGYRESTGLQDRRAGNRTPIYEEPVDGLDVRLTLDLDMQRGAELLLEDPGPPPPDEDRPDHVWHGSPVGALVLITVEGDVLVAASGPSRSGHAVAPGSYDDERARARDRCLDQPRFQPPGSVFKPFVAALALDRGWIRPDTEFSCIPSDKSPTLGAHRADATVRCLGVHWEHVDLRTALTKSCNSYFAAVGEQFFDGPEMRRLGRAFGFDRPTGVRSLDAEGGGDSRAGLREAYRASLFFTDESMIATAPMLQRLGNGLTHLSATPLQVARAYAGLATGSLPELRLIDAVGERVLPRRASPLPFSRASLEAVRASLAEVPVTGTARDRQLDLESLGFRLACKTGSADYQPGLVPVDPLAPVVPQTDGAAWKDGMRKHGWVAGWFPADRPAAVVVAYVHDTSTTARHIATHLCARFLRSGEVQAWVAERGLGGAR